MFGNRLEDLLRIEIEFAHGFREQIPFDLHVGQEEVAGRQNRMATALGLVGRTIQNPPGTIPYLVW